MDSRLEEMLFRYRSRNFPDTLNVDELEKWQAQRLQRLLQPSNDRQLNPERFSQVIAEERVSKQEDANAQRILDQLEAWGNEIINP